MKARAHRGIWIADCVCRSASRLYRMQPGFICPECGARIEVEWPSEEMVYGIERLLLMRPDPLNQNWLPGETLQDLAWENGAHGVFTDIPAGMDQLVIEPERIRVDTLPLAQLREFRALGGVA
jgi:hypothetical protein